jgi:hypothetical protein
MKYIEHSLLKTSLRGLHLRGKDLRVAGNCRQQSVFHAFGRNRSVVGSVAVNLFVYTLEQIFLGRHISVQFVESLPITVALLLVAPSEAHFLIDLLLVLLKGLLVFVSVEGVNVHVSDKTLFSSHIVQFLNSRRNTSLRSEVIV